MLVKLQASGYGREEVKRCADIFRDPDRRCDGDAVHGTAGDKLDAS